MSDHLLSVNDIMGRYGCGSTKGYLIMHQVPIIRVGRAIYAREADIVEAEESGLLSTLDWASQRSGSRRPRPGGGE